MLLNTQKKIDKVIQGNQEKVAYSLDEEAYAKTLQNLIKTVETNEAISIDEADVNNLKTILNSDNSLS